MDVAQLVIDIYQRLGEDVNNELDGYQKLHPRAYISTIAPGWTIERQEALLAERVPGWPRVTVYRDEPTARQRQAHQASGLLQRAAMLRSTKPRPGGETIYCATLAVLAQGKVDFLAVLDAARARGATILPVDTGIAIGAAVPAEEAAAAYMASRLAGSQAKARQLGAVVSAAIRRARADDGCERIRERWGMPSDAWPTAALCAEAGAPGNPLSYNSVVARLGGREKAQARYQAAIKRAATRKAKADGRKD